MGAGRARADIDWAAVERAYRTSAASVTQIARRHGVGRSALYRRAKREGWRRKAAAGKGASPARSGPPGPRATKAAGSRSRRASPRGGARDQARGPAAQGKKARPAASRSDLRDDLGRLRALAEKLRVRLERVIEGEEGESVLGKREGPITLLVKLCQVTEKIIALERQLEGEPAGAEAVDLSENDKAILERFKRRLRPL